MVELASFELPEFGLPAVEPVIPADTYRRRLTRLRQIARENGYDVFVIYGDREHFANLAYLTGYDPRFEEALLILDLAGRDGTRPILIVGNEGLGYSRVSPIKDELEVVLYQSFSLLGQDRSRSPRLPAILQAAGIRAGRRVGVAGWKHFGHLETETPDTWLDIPAYLVDTLRSLTGQVDLVRNSNALLMDSSRGLRAINDVDQLAQFEFAAAHASQAVRNMLFGLRVGMTEFEAVELMRLNGLPLSCHLMLSAGERAFMGMSSPSSRRIQRGDPFTTAVGLWGGLTCRAGFVVESAHELPANVADYVEKLVTPYFSAIAAWYEHVGIGVSGGELYQIVHDRIGDPFFGVGLNPGHLIHLDEWVNSPIYAGSTEHLEAGMALQVDVIPATNTPYYTTNIEDGIALADDAMRAEFAERYPEAWTRIQARRAFMQEALGIHLKQEVLPFSNIPAYLPPFLLAPGQALRLRTSP
jgi:Xaa-Pro aminopeptidase